MKQVQPIHSNESCWCLKYTYLQIFTNTGLPVKAQNKAYESTNIIWTNWHPIWLEDFIRTQKYININVHGSCRLNSQYDDALSLVCYSTKQNVRMRQSWIINLKRMVNLTNCLWVIETRSQELLITGYLQKGKLKARGSFSILSNREIK